MNREASVFFPPEVFGHHIGPEKCHMSGRVLSMQFRAFSAAASGGHMGMELDLRKLSAQDQSEVAPAIAFFAARGPIHRPSTITSTAPAGAGDGG